MITELQRAIAQHIPLGFLTEREVTTWKRKAGQKLHASEDCDRFKKQKSAASSSNAPLGEVVAKLCDQCSYQLQSLFELEERKLVVQAAALAAHAAELSSLQEALERAKMSPEERAGLRHRYRGLVEDGAPRTAARAAKLQAELDQFRLTRSGRCAYSHCRDVYNCTGASSPECQSFTSAHPELVSAFEELTSYSIGLTRAARALERAAAALARDPRDELRLLWYLASLEVHKRHAGHSGLMWSGRDVSACPTRMRPRAKVLEVEQRYHFGKPRYDDVVRELWQRFAVALHPTQGEAPESLEAALEAGRVQMRQHLANLKWAAPYRRSDEAALTIDGEDEDVVAERAWREQASLFIEELGETWSAEMREILDAGISEGQVRRSLVALCNTGRRRLIDSHGRNLGAESVLRYETCWVGDGENLLAGGLVVLPSILARALSVGGVLDNQLRGVEVTSEEVSTEVLLTTSALLGDELIGIQANAEAAEVVRTRVMDALEAARCALS